MGENDKRSEYGEAVDELLGNIDSWFADLIDGLQDIIDHLGTEPDDARDDDFCMYNIRTREEVDGQVVRFVGDKPCILAVFAGNEQVTREVVKGGCDEVERRLEEMTDGFGYPTSVMDVTKYEDDEPAVAYIAVQVNRDVRDVAAFDCILPYLTVTHLLDDIDVHDFNWFAKLARAASDLKGAMDMYCRNDRARRAVWARIQEWDK